MTCERPPSPLPDRVQANQTLDVGAVLAPRHVGSDLAMSNTDTSELLRLFENFIAMDGHFDGRLGKDGVILARALKSRLQAEAQAPTTATSVLTELAPAFKTTSWLSAYLADCAGDPEDNDSLMTMGEVRNVLLAVLTMRDRLTVGAPAPAPTMPTKKDVLTLALEWLNIDSPLSDDDFYNRMCVLFAKGDTP